MTTCTICTTRLSLDDGTHAHPHCRGAAPLTEPEMGRLVVARWVEPSPATHTGSVGEVGCRSQLGEQVAHCGRHRGPW